MRLKHHRACKFALLFWLGAIAGSAFADTACEEDASWAASDALRHFVVLAARRGVFHDGGGPAFVTVVKADAAEQELETGAVGIYSSGDGRRVFGAAPPRVYDELMSESGNPDEVLLRLEVTGPQHARVLEVLRTWDRRARENVLLYPDLTMNTILFVKQAAEALNRCGDVIDLYTLDWGIDDKISDDNAHGLVPFLFFEELKRRNGSLHVPSSGLPAGVLIAGGPSETREARADESQAHPVHE